jgi:hypothetical protein
LQHFHFHALRNLPFRVMLSSCNLHCQKLSR